MDTATPAAPAAAQAEAPKPGEAQPQATPAPAEGAQPAQPAEPQKPERTFTQAELDEILEKRLAKERRKREELRQERDVLRKLALEHRPQAEPEPQHRQQPTGEPTREQFGSYEEFIEARAAYRATQAVDAKMKEREEADRTARAQAEAKTAGEQFRQRAKETAKDIPDFDEVMSNITAADPVARVAADPIATADNPGKLLYHLATHPDEAERIASLPVGQQAREVWKLEQKLAAAPQARASAAPEPIRPVGGKATTGDEMPDPQKDPQAWVKWRNAQLRARKAAGAKRA